MISYGSQQHRSAVACRLSGAAGSRLHRTSSATEARRMLRVIPAIELVISQLLR
jgi:hypothetical protein